MYDLAPGSILQRMHIQRRIRSIQECQGNKALKFCEIGTGQGSNSSLLLNLGLSGIGFELNADSITQNLQANKQFIENGTYQISNSDFFDHDFKDERFDIIFSCMVIEHLTDALVDRYFSCCHSLLKPNGIVITLAPASMKHWGIEDEIAGHYKRYSFDCFEQIARKKNYALQQLVGLTYPLSNWLLPLSNKLVRDSEARKLELSMQQRTELSGNREVNFKTSYPRHFRYMLNEVTMLPFFFLQQLNHDNPNALVVYCELSPNEPKKI